MTTDISDEKSDYMTVEQVIAANIFRVDPHTPIYRILKAEHLLGDFRNETLTLSRVIGWEDTQEAAYFRRRLTLGKEGVAFDALSRDWFGQCYSLEEESDAMWRIYNHDGLSVRIKTTPAKLIANLFAARCRVQSDFAKYARIALWIGGVDYQNKSQFQATLARDPDTVLDPSAKAIAELLSVKRDAFRHEAEVRVLFGCQFEPTTQFEYNETEKLTEVSHDTQDRLYLSRDFGEIKVDGKKVQAQRFLHLPYDWSDLDQVVIGPRAQPEQIDQVTKTLDLLGRHGVRFEQSELYGPLESKGQPRMGAPLAECLAPIHKEFDWVADTAKGDGHRLG